MSKKLQSLVLYSDCRLLTSWNSPGGAWLSLLPEERRAREEDSVSLSGTGCQAGWDQNKVTGALPQGTCL